MARNDELERIRQNSLERIASSERMIEWLSDPDVKLVRREGTSTAEDVKAILLFDHRMIIANARRTIQMIDEMAGEAD